MTPALDIVNCCWMEKLRKAHLLAWPEPRTYSARHRLSFRLIGLIRILTWQVVTRRGAHWYFPQSDEILSSEKKTKPQKTMIRLLFLCLLKGSLSFMHPKFTAPTTNVKFASRVGMLDLEEAAVNMGLEVRDVVCPYIGPHSDLFLWILFIWNIHKLIHFYLNSSILQGLLFYIKEHQKS